MAHELHSSNSIRPRGTKQRQPGMSWSPPPLRSLKLNTDAGVFNDGTVGFGFIVRNEQGQPVFAGTKRCKAPSANSTMLEALALRFGVSEAVSKGLQIMILETDSQILARALQRETEVDVSTTMIVADILAEADYLVAREFLWVKREANRVAHFLAHCNLEYSSTHIWTNEVPSLCNRLVLDDVRREPLNLVI
ncbi:hypothetical protein ACS0TY_034480 [Phlomoides rotata]